MSKLFVNIDHVATIRNQRCTPYPDIIKAAKICEENGAKGITVHLREDRRHIRDEDVRKLRESISTVLNLEMAATEEMIKIAKLNKPDISCIVPEKREELTTEGGLDVKRHFSKLKDCVERLQSNNIEVSLFIEPDYEQIDYAKKTTAVAVEIHTGTYANASSPELKNKELEKILKAVDYAVSLGLRSNAGHGLDYANILALCPNPKISEFNIGHSIVSYAVLHGLAKATRDMADIIEGKKKNDL